MSIVFAKNESRTVSSPTAMELTSYSGYVASYDKMKHL